MRRTQCTSSPSPFLSKNHRVHKEKIIMEIPYLLFQFAAWMHSWRSFPQIRFPSLEFDLGKDASWENRKQMYARFKRLFLLSFPSNWIRGGGRAPAASGYPPAAVTLIHVQAAHGSRGDNVIMMCQWLWQETDRLDARFWAELWPVMSVLCLLEWYGRAGSFQTSC